MGSSIRAVRWAYTEWRAWDGAALRAGWSGVEHAVEVASSAKGGKVYQFSAESESECEEWMAAISGVIDLHNGGGARDPAVASFPNPSSRAEAAAAATPPPAAAPTAAATAPPGAGASHRRASSCTSTRATPNPTRARAANGRPPPPGRTP